MEALLVNSQEYLQLNQIWMIKFQVPCDILQPFILFYWCQHSSKQQNQSCLEEHRKVIFCWTLWKRFWTLLGYRAPNEECILLKDSSKLSTLSFLLNVKSFCRFSSFYPWLARTFTCSHQLTFTANLLKWCIRSSSLNTLVLQGISAFYRLLIYCIFGKHMTQIADSNPPPPLKHLLPPRVPLDFINLLWHFWYLAASIDSKDACKL